jgi:hypothetical protein
MLLDPASASPRPTTLNKDGKPRKAHTLRDLPHEPLAESRGGMLCNHCNQFLSKKSFPSDRGGRRGVGSYCRICTRVYRQHRAAHIQDRQKKRYEWKHEEIKKQAIEWRKANPAIILLAGARARSRTLGVPFNLTLEDINIPECCPVFGFPLQRNITGKRANCSNFNSPNLDRIVPKLGYVRGNVQVISKKANLMKWSRSPKEWEAFARWILAIAETNDRHTSAKRRKRA